MGFSDDFSDFGHGRRSYRSGPPAGRARGASGGPPCPTCGSRNNAVIDSRPFEGGQRRRRKCMEKDSCARWNTYETNTDPELLKAPDLSTLDKSRIIRLAETSAALAKSLKLDV